MNIQLKHGGDDLPSIRGVSVSAIIQWGTQVVVGGPQSRSSYFPRAVMQGFLTH